MIERLRRRREELQELLRNTAIQLEQVRGALAFCNELIQAAEGNGLDVQAASSNERKDPIVVD